MSSISISSPFPTFTDVDGDPLESGYIYVGQANVDPVTFPITVYWDAALTIPAAQPIRTIGGYPARNGSPARIYANSDYSIRVTNKNGSLVYSAPAATDRFSGVVVDVDAADVAYTPAGTGAVATTVQAKLRESVSVRDFGAVGNGVADDTAAIQAAINSGATHMEIPQGMNCRTTAPLEINTTVFINGNGSIISPDSSVLEAVKVGNLVLVSRGGVRDLQISKAAYSGATENIGVALYNCVSLEFENVECRNQKYPWHLKPAASQRVAYNLFLNCNSVGGLYNLYINPSSTGFANENTWVGGRLFGTSDTTTQLYISAGGSSTPDHNRFIGVSMEGTGDQAIYCAGSDNYFEYPRTEGTWSVNDVVLAGSFNMLVSSRYDLSVTDSGTGNQYITYGSGTKFETGSNNVTTLSVNRLGANTASNPAIKVKDTYSGTGTSYGIEYRHGRDTSASYFFKVIRDSDSLVRSSLTTDGRMTVAQQFINQQSSWAFSPFVLGTYTLWVDSSGRLRIKNGTPTSDTDGTIVGTQT